MKNMVLILTITLSSILAFAQDSNLRNDSNMQAGTFVPGTNFSDQVRVCKSCQNRNNLKLSDQTDIARPGSNSGSGSGSGATQDGGVNNQLDPLSNKFQGIGHGCNFYVFYS